LKLIRIKSIYTYRIGHFVVNAHEELNLYDENGTDKYWFFFNNPRENANKYWALMVKRSLPVKPFFAQYVAKWLKLIWPGNPILLEGSVHTSSRYLKTKGWNYGQPLVSLVVRDDAYYKLSKYRSDYSRRSHSIFEQSYRNSSIENYLHSVKWLNSKGVWVLRMGAIAESRLEYSHGLFIDYPFISDKSDFLDIWLIANSSGVISTSTGLDSVACIYKVPQLTLNFLPLTALYSYSNSISVPKKVFNKFTQKKLTVTENLNLTNGNKWPTMTDYVKRGIDIIDLSPEEILLATMEFWGRVEGNYVSSEEDNFLQDKFWQIFKAHPDYNFNHGWKHPNSRIGRDWLKSMGEDFLR
jgi:putative glycosyltransferase (TIGR04372 family)